MRKDQAYHLCRAAASIAGTEYVFVFGSNAIVFWLEDIGLQDTQELLGEYASRDLDLSVSEDDEYLNMVVDGAIGELSSFDETFGVYAHANLPKNLFRAPDSWVERIKIEKEPLSGTKVAVPSPVDLVFAKMLGFREKDWVFCTRVMTHFEIPLEQVERLAEEYVAEHPEEDKIVRKGLDLLRGKLEGAERYDSNTPTP